MPTGKGGVNSGSNPSHRFVVFSFIGETVNTLRLLRAVFMEVAVLEIDEEAQPLNLLFESSDFYHQEAMGGQESGEQGGEEDG